MFRVLRTMVLQVQYTCTTLAAYHTASLLSALACFISAFSGGWFVSVVTVSRTSVLSVMMRMISGAFGGGCCCTSLLLLLAASSRIYDYHQLNIID